MLKAALHQLNSEPVVILKKIEKCSSTTLPDYTTNRDRDAMQRYQIVKKSPDPRDHSSTSLNLKINLSGGVPTCLKRKASLEDAFTEADAVYETPKKLRRDESVESDFQKKKAKHLQTEIKAIQDQKSKMPENDKEKGKLKKKLEKEKFKSTKPEHRSETGGSGFSSSEHQSTHSQKRVKRHERKKKKSREKSKESSRCASKNTILGNREHFGSDEIINDTGEPVALISQQGGNMEEVSSTNPKPTSLNEAVTDEEVFEDPEDQTGALVQEKNNFDVPRSDSAATVALDIEFDRQSINSSVDHTEPVEVVNLVSPDKASTAAENSGLPSNSTTEDEMELEAQCSQSVNPPDEICKQLRFKYEKQIQEEVSLQDSHTASSNDAEKENPFPVVNPNGPLANTVGSTARADPMDEENVVEDKNTIGADHTTPLDISNSHTECSHINEVEKSAHMEADKSENGEMDSMEDQSDTLPLECLEEGVVPPSHLEAEQGKAAVCLAKTACSPSSTNLKTVSDASMSIVGDHFDEKTGKKSLAPVDKVCCMSINAPAEQLNQREWEIRQEKLQIQAALSEIFSERRTLNKELRLLVSKSEKLEQESGVKNIDISANVLAVQALSDEVNIAREERNRLAAEKKRTHHMVLQTEIKLRELQVQLIRQQLDQGDAKLVEPNPLLDITENEKRVAELTEEVANKSTVHKQTETAYQKAEHIFRQKNEELETLVKVLDEARQMCQELNDDLNKVTSEIEKAKLKLEDLADEGKKRCLRAVDIEEEIIKIEFCKKLKQNEVNRQEITAIKDAMAFEEIMPNLNILLAIEIHADKTESEIIPSPLPENSTSVNVDSPNQEPSPCPIVQCLPSTVPPVTVAESQSTLSTEEAGTLAIETVTVSAELPSHVEMECEALPPQTQPICLRIQNTSAVDFSPTLSSTTTPAMGSPSVTQSAKTNNPVAIRMADSLSNSESMQASTSQNITTASFAVLPLAISLNSLNDAYPFFSQFVNPNSPTANSDDETLLNQEIVNSCRQFTQWKSNYACSKDITSLSRDNPLLRQGAEHMKDYFVPFYRLMIKKNTTTASLLDLIVLQAQKASWYGMPAVDSTYMKQMLENNLRCAIEVGMKFKDQACILPSRVEFSPSSGKSSMPTFTIHLATPEAFRSPTLASHMQISAQSSEHSPVERSQVTRVLQDGHSPIGALSTMLTNHVRQVHHQTPPFAHNSPNALMTEGHPTMPRQGWAGNSESNGLAYPSTVVQNTAVVTPIMNAQYTGRHRMPAVQQTVPPPQSSWPQQQAAHQAYVQTLQSTRMQVPVSYQAGSYRQQQATLQHQYTNHNGLQQMSQSQQLQHCLMGSGSGDNLSRQNMPLLGSHLQGHIPVQQQRVRQQPASQQLSNQQPGPNHIAGIQQQQVSQSQSHSLPGGHQLMQKQRQIPMSSPPVNAQAQRHFAAQSSEVPRQSVSRRPSREVPQHQVYTCLKCGQEAQQKCSGCQTTFYCSRDCQVAHWDEHGKTCSKQV
ncbi:uncharacterized protein LOC130697565 [Daphnia carinata]|uniref:uncharacterized protein LOC130697565 n=1 Tax=Daphnia carinata TaxID=120202 RepID=UPI00257C60C7|nr:uncharacterized protein LOC130697565 [Daphnia carinata]XP_057376458.1 uncharacterized protein LOC130697565 [Daphnia carinata]